MKDKNGVAIKLGDEVLYCDGLFDVAGEYDGRAILWPMDPGLCDELIVVGSQLLVVKEPIRGFWRWLLSFMRPVPKPAEERSALGDVLFH